MTSASADRLSGVDDLRRGTARPQATPTAPVTPSRLCGAGAGRRPRKAATVAHPRQDLAAARQRVRRRCAAAASSTRLKSRNRELFDGITGYVAKSPDRARLVIGPFRGQSDAEIFASDLETVGIDAFKWTNSDSDRIVPLGTE